MSTLSLSRLKFPATGNEVFDLLEVAPRNGVGVVATVEGGWFKRQYVELNAISPRGQMFIGAYYNELRRLGRA